MLHAMGDEAFQVSPNLESRVEELALKRYVPLGSRLMSEEEINEWTAWIWKAESALEHSC